MTKDKERIKASALLLLILFNLIALLIVFDLREDPTSRVLFFDVGQGDGALISTAEGHRILIDGGPGQKILPELSSEIPFWDRRIDLVILTHAHADHLSGLVEVLRRYQVDKILWNGQEADTLIYKEWEKLIEDKDVEIAVKGQRIDLGDGHLDVLFPPEDYDFSADLNEGSVINRLVYEKGAVLFMGDAYKVQEEKLIRWEEECQVDPKSWCRVMELPSEVLKAGHHGSSTSSSRSFIRRVAPGLVVISAGEDNRYGHPHRETIEVLKNSGVDIHKTFSSGSLEIILE